jgi:hypothetical protein
LRRFENVDKELFYDLTEEAPEGEVIAFQTLMNNDKNIKYFYQAS